MLIFIGAAIFLFGIIISEALYTGYHVTQVISDLGVGSTAWLFNSTIFMFGILVIISAYLLLNIGTDRYFTLLLGLTGMGAFLVGLVPETYGTLHVIAAGVVFVSGGLCAIAGYNVFRGPFSLLSPLFGCITLLATASPRIKRISRAWDRRYGKDDRLPAYHMGAWCRCLPDVPGKMKTIYPINISFGIILLFQPGNRS